MKTQLLIDISESCSQSIPPTRGRRPQTGGAVAPPIFEPAVFAEPRRRGNWGWPALAWGGGLATLGIVVAGLMWMDRQQRDERTLALLARPNAPARQVLALPPAPLVPRADVSMSLPLAPAALPQKIVREKAKAAVEPADLLRQCRAVGYHADQCQQRRCVLTRYGLACRG